MAFEINDIGLVSSWVSKVLNLVYIIWLFAARQGVNWHKRVEGTESLPSSALEPVEVVVRRLANPDIGRHVCLKGEHEHEHDPNPFHRKFSGFSHMVASPNPSWSRAAKSQTYGPESKTHTTTAVFPQEGDTDSIVYPELPPLSATPSESPHGHSSTGGGDCAVVPAILAHAQLHVRYECIRLMGRDHRFLQSLTAARVEVLDDYDNMIMLVREHLGHDHTGLSWPRSGVWREAANGFEHIAMAANASLKLADGALHLDDVKLEPLTLSMSSRMTRAFGGYRFLKLQIRIDEKKFRKYTTSCLKGSLVAFLGSTMTLLGNDWQVWRMQRGSSMEEGSWSRQVVLHLDLFATVLRGLHPTVRPQHPRPNPVFFGRKNIPIADLLAWFICVATNQDMTLSRTYARLDLGMSRSTATLVFRPSQIRSVPDVLANGEPETGEFADTTLSWMTPGAMDAPRIMNDGCARLSTRAARLIANELGLEGPVPSVFQARIGGYKGVWIACDTLQEQDGDPVWIEVTPTQRKFNAHPADRKDETYDPRRTTFEVLTFSTRLQPSRLSHTMLPVLVDRGVEEQDIHTLYREVLRQDHQNFLAALAEPCRLREWILRRCGKVSSVQDEWLGGLPSTKISAALYLIEHGFTPRSNEYLADIVKSLADNVFSSVPKALNLHLPSSVMPLGVADPVGCLVPGEVHLTFSATYFDSHLNRSYSCLSDMEVLVGRHPVIRPSDIQRVRAVFKAGLADIRDTVVFPSRGTFPLAGKMSNGDYDGDRFWVCWHPALVKNFRNAPAPLGLPDPAALGAKQVLVPLSAAYHPGKKTLTTQQLLTAGIGARLSDDLRGLVGWCHENLIYKLGHTHPETTFLADVRELLMDGVKMGLELSRPQFLSLLKSRGLLSHCMTVKPLYRRLIEQSKGQRAVKQCSPHNVVDRVLVMTVLPTIASLDVVTKTSMSDKGSDDQHSLGRPYADTEKAMLSDKKLSKDVGQLKQKLTDLYLDWQKIWRSEESSSVNTRQDHFNQVRVLREQYQALQISSRSPLICDPVCKQDFILAPTPFDLMKASLLWVQYGNCPFTFRMAGKELAYLNAWASSAQVYSVVPHMHSLGSRKGYKYNHTTRHSTRLFNAAAQGDDEQYDGHDMT